MRINYTAMKILAAEFIRSCTEPEQLPRDRAPEIAIVGRSNVGKSSLINSLLQRRKLAKVSGTPGKTRMLNVIRVTTAEPALRDLYFIDLPGYGYAKVSKAVRQQWGPMIDRYLTERTPLAGVVMLVDARGLEAQDRSTVEWLRSLGQEPIVVVTKMDKLPRGARQLRLAEISDALALADQGVAIGYSSVTHEGRDELWRAILKSVKRDT
jgi:GTP-binding protein